MFKLIGVDNHQSYGTREVGHTGNFTYDGNMFYFNTMHSSTVESINKIDDELIVQTKNSKYIFKKV